MSSIEEIDYLKKINQGEYTLGSSNQQEMKVLEKFWEVLNYFTSNGKLPNNFTFDDFKKYNRENMILMSNKSGFHEFLNTFFSDLKESNLFKESDFIDESGKFNSDNFFKNIDRIIILLYFISSNNEEIKLEVVHDHYQEPTSGDSYTTSVCEEQKKISEYDRFIFRIVYLTIIDYYSEPVMFHIINEEILGKNNLDQNSSEKFSLEYKIYAFMGKLN